MKIHTLTIVVAASLATSSGALSAQAADGPASESPNLVQRLYNCATKEIDTERLRCYDAGVAELRNAQDRKELVIADREQIEEARRGLFGFSLPQLRLFSSGNDSDANSHDIDEISATIENVSTSRLGKMHIQLTNGARWVQTDNTPIYGSVTKGDAITIKRAALGSYLAKIRTKRAFRVRRVD